MKLRVILHGGKDFAGMASAADWAIRNAPWEPGKLFGIRFLGVYYSIKFGNQSISVWRNDDGGEQ
ncbi:hypothetical protein [Paradevosia shaoguanensis]|uniref:hypothetical protein n=1 Tax=Paradevosia shaoguanensis TaxID=1335043 RepID=UPI0019346776|nr:hypothetical protein [Paradevosia shaoguanensis]